MKLEIGERLCIAKLFNKGGYVLNFTTAQFDDFTKEYVGIRLTEKYGLSKGASLEKFVSDNEAETVVTLLEKLLEYAIAYDDTFELQNFNAVNKCRQIVRKYRKDNSIPELTKRFSSEYIIQLKKSIDNAVQENPTEAIGKAKELIESCCKTILDNLGVDYKCNVDLSQLIDITIEKLKLKPQNISETVKEAASIKSLLGNLRAIATSMATLRNAYGSGHGKSASYKGLTSRHAKLAVGSSITLVNFLWETFEDQAQTNKITTSKSRQSPNTQNK